MYKADVDLDASTGSLVVAWYSNVTNKAGIYTRELFASGPGPERYVPTSATADRKSSLGALQRVGITGRIGAGGVYVGFGSGYPTYGSVKIWRFGDAAPLMSIAAKSARFVNLTAEPEGRLWLMWERSGRIYAMRTNRAASRASRVVSTKPPSGTSSS